MDASLFSAGTRAGRGHKLSKQYEGQFGQVGQCLDHHTASTPQPAAQHCCDKANMSLAMKYIPTGLSILLLLFIQFLQ